MEASPVVFAVPAYAALIGLEAWWARVRRRRVYELPELLANTVAGLGQLVTDLWLGALYVVPYQWLWTRAAWPARLSEHDPLAWILGLLGVDFAFYWQHRISHRVNFIWAAHVVHHQPRHYNLGVALRQPWFSVLTNWIYYQPLALLGVPVEVFVASVAINLAYQFYLHTTFVGDMGWLGAVLNTPSHHRVHHGRNARYLDKNYGGVLIVWDRLFGTFQKEDEPVLFGTTRPYLSHDGVWANFDYWRELLRRSKDLRSWGDRVALWFRPPEWHAAGEPPPPPVPAPPRAGRAVIVYASFVTVTAVIGAALLMARPLAPAAAAVGALGVIWALGAVGGLLDGRSWAKPAEIARWCTMAIVFVFYAQGARGR